MKKLVLDVDGVLLDFGKTYIEVAQELYGNKLVPNLLKYDLHDLLQITKEENDKVWDYFSQKDSFSNLSPYPGVIESIKRINQDNLEVYIVTAIDKCYESARLNNLKKIGLIPKEIYCVGGNHSSKRDVILEINPDAFVDDRLDNLFNSIEVKHKVWVDQGHTQRIERFNDISVVVTSLYDWVNSSHYQDNLKNTYKFKSKNMAI